MAGIPELGGCILRLAPGIEREPGHEHLARFREHGSQKALSGRFRVIPGIIQARVNDESLFIDQCTVESVVLRLAQAGSGVQAGTCKPLFYQDAAQTLANGLRPAAAEY